MPILFYSELKEIQATLTESRAYVAPEPAMCRRLDNSIELVKDLMRRANELSTGGEVEPAPMITLFPVAAQPVGQEFLEAFKLASELAVRASRKFDFIESALILRLEGWKVQEEYEQDGRCRGLLRAKVEEIRRILDNARA